MLHVACCIWHQVEFSPVKAHTYIEYGNNITTLRFFFYPQVTAARPDLLPPTRQRLSVSGCVLNTKWTDSECSCVRIRACS